MRAAIVALVVAATAPAAEPVVLHVAPHGTDAGTGQPDRPFATVGRARGAIRALKADNGGRLPNPVTVRLHGGHYRLSEPLVLTPDDAGTADCPIIYEASPGETPVLSGGRELTGWHAAQVNGRPGWSATAPGPSYPHQL